ncbi:histidine ammonia-lyase, partial [bacterium]|nr:histidine ammonia-lyase [bacterium]
MVIVDGHSLTLEQVRAVSQGEHVELHQTAAGQIDKARAWIEKIVSAGANAPLVYGINTGFGSLKSERFSISKARLVSRNLIVSHSAGTGEPFAPEVTRAAMLLRANAMTPGHSGVRRVVVETLLEMLNKGVVPIVPSQGSLGASGDLAPLSHLALVLSRDPHREDGDANSGEAWFNGSAMSGRQAMVQARIKRLVLEAKEGLALNNGVQYMTALAVLAVLNAEALLQLHDIAVAMHIDAACGVRHAFDARIAGIRRYQGHAQVAKNVLALLEGSSFADSDPLRIQDAYSIRCSPQIAGAVRDAVAHVRAGLEIEINSVTDNPLIFPDQDESLSGGNFHGDPVGLRVDYLKTVLTELGNLSERRINRLMDRNHNYGLPPYLSRHPGIESGMMMASYTAAALASENKVLAHPASVDSIPTSENQEDIVSMGTHGARQATAILRNVETIIAIELLCAAQALDLRMEKTLGQLGRGTAIAHRVIRDKIPTLEHDRQMSDDIAYALR